ncbi:MAG: methylated-DNA--[protein]-cysteine S-methyltransferase [Mariniphaga sp.]|nr:methylated-DNA--[protein]-cysteine S-methyltransferase [Mariniphaga sp.]
MKEIYKKTISTPIGFLVLGSSELVLKYIHFSDSPDKDSDSIPEILLKTKQQIIEYFEGKRFSFDLKMEPEGTDFQRSVWNLVLDISFGETNSYNKIALKLGNTTFTRAVGMANAKNPIPIVIPCHRIVGANGKLVGYAGGLERKKQLLLHEIKYQKKGILF